MRTITVEDQSKTKECIRTLRDRGLEELKRRDEYKQ